jgi:hypothetical protein
MLELHMAGAQSRAAFRLSTDPRARGTCIVAAIAAADAAGGLLSEGGHHA